MSHIILACGQSGYCIISVPPRIAENASQYQKAFDKWLMDRSNDHGYWQADPDCGAYLCYHPPEAFVRWLNETVLTSDACAAIVGDDVPLLHF